MKKKSKVCWLIYIAAFVVFLYIGYKVPYCHDEWQWGLDERIELMKNGFKDYNGRYLGDLLALLVTRSVLAKAVVLAAGVVWLLDVMYKNIRFEEESRTKENTFLLLGAFFLLISIPSTLFQQSYGWPAAFVNFVPPVFLFLIYYNWTEWVYTKQKQPAIPAWETIMVIPLGISVQLFSENITVFVAFYAVWIVVYTLIRYKKIPLIELNFLWASIAGALIMFSNGAYSRAADGSDGYKEIHTTVSGMARQFISNIWYHLSINNWVLNILLIIVLLILIQKSGRKTFATIEMTVVFCGYSVYSVFHKIYPQWVFDSDQNLNNAINTMLAILFFANVLLCIWKNVDRKEGISMCILYLSSGAVAAPLLAANPIGARCFYVSYIFQALLLLKLLRYLTGRYRTELFYPILITGMAVCVLCVIYVRMFLAIGQVNDYRAQLIQTGIEQEQKEIVLPVLPYSEYCCQTIPPNERWAKRFKKFYHIPEDVTVRFEQILE